MDSRTSTITHLAKARAYIEQGDRSYASAADEIIAALDADADLTWAVVAESVGKSDRWCRRLATQRRDHLASGDPKSIFTVDWERGGHATAEEIERGAAKVMADPEKRQRVLDSMATEEKAEIASGLISDEEVATSVVSSQAGVDAADALLDARVEGIGRKARGERERTGPSATTKHAEATSAMSDQIAKARVAAQRIEDYLHGSLGYVESFTPEDMIRYEQACEQIARKFTQLASDAKALAQARTWTGDPSDVA